MKIKITDDTLYIHNNLLVVISTDSNLFNFHNFFNFIKYEYITSDLYNSDDTIKNILLYQVGSC